MKVKEGIIGFVVGDALGVPHEFKPRVELEKNPVTGMEGGGLHNQLPGTWSDDSSMIIATMTSIINKKAIDYDDIMNEFCNWLIHYNHTPYGEVFDNGLTSGTAIQRYNKGIPALECGGKSEHDNGNGSLMRILPLAFINDIDFETIENVSALTHNTKRARITCVLYVQIAKSMIENDGLTIEEHVKLASDKIIEYYSDSEELHNLSRIFNNDYSQGVLSTGYVIYTLECAIYCLETTDNYKDAVLKAVNLGGDTDTVAGLCGGLAGIYYGYDSIPIDWLNQIVKLDEILSLCENYEAFCDES